MTTVSAERLALCFLLVTDKRRAKERESANQNKEKCSAYGAQSLARTQQAMCSLSRSRRLLQLAPYCNMAACNDTARESESAPPDVSYSGKFKIDQQMNCSFE